MEYSQNDKKKRVLIVAPSLDTGKNVSGLSAVANFVIAHNKECEYVHFQQGRSDGESGTFNRIMRIWRNYREWKRIINDNVNLNGKFIIHYNYPLDAASIVRDFFFMKVAHKRGLPMVIHIHGGLYLFKEKQPFIIKRILNEVFSWENPFIVLSDKEREQIQKRYYTKNVEVLANCVTSPGNLDDNLNLNRNGKVDMLYLGRIEPNKGMDYLLEAMKILKKEGRAFTLHFAGVEQGKNGYIERFQSILGKQFIYEGVVSGTQKTDLFKRCQIFVLPSFYEGLPISLLETMSYGLVPVVTDVGSIGEYVKNGENGLLLKVKDAQSIVEALDKLSRHDELLQRLSANARQTISERLNPIQYIKQLNSIYAQTIRY